MTIWSGKWNKDRIIFKQQKLSWDFFKGTGLLESNFKKSSSLSVCLSSIICLQMNERKNIEKSKQGCVVMAVFPSEWKQTVEVIEVLRLSALLMSQDDSVKCSDEMRNKPALLQDVLGEDRPPLYTTFFTSAG